MSREDIKSIKLNTVFISVLLGDSTIKKDTAGDGATFIQLNLNDESKRYLMNFIDSYQLPINLSYNLATKTYEIRGTGLADFLSKYPNKDTIRLECITPEVLIMWVCLFAQPVEDSFVINTQAYSNYLQDSIIHAYFQLIKNARIASIDNQFFLDNLQELFEITVTNKLSTVHSIRLSNLMLEKAQSGEFYLNKIESFRKFVKGERLNNVPFY